MDFDRLDKLAQKYMKKRKSHASREIGAVYYHGVRVAQGALALRKRLTEDASMDDCLRCAAMFHDIGKGMEPHGPTGEMLVRGLLRDEMTPEEMEKVCGLIAVHQDRKPGKNDFSLWQMILQDADLLDHYGAQGLWMSCIYYAYCGQQEMMQVPAFYETEWPEQRAHHRRLLNFDISKAIFDEKTAFEDQVSRRMREEGMGQYMI